MLGIQIDLDSAVPGYRQIADQIRSLIARGDLKDGTELPSVRQLGAMVGMNLNTVAKAYRLLADERLIELRHGSGATVCAPESRSKRRVSDAEVGRKLHALLGEWILGGADRAEIERAVGLALDGYFSGARTAKGG